jgi:hypothetical protein
MSPDAPSLLLRVSHLWLFCQDFLFPIARRQTDVGGPSEE